MLRDPSKGAKTPVASRHSTASRKTTHKRIGKSEKGQREVNQDAPTRCAWTVAETMARGSAMVKSGEKKNGAKRPRRVEIGLHQDNVSRHECLKA